MSSRAFSQPMKRSWSRQLRRFGPWAVHLSLAGLVVLSVWHATGHSGAATPGGPDAAAVLRETAGRKTEPVIAAPGVLDKVTWRRNLRQAAATKIIAKAKPPDPVRIEFTGAVIDGSNSMAFLKDAGGKVQMKSVGQQLDGWTVIEIHESSAIVKKGDRQERLKLKSPL